VAKKRGIFIPYRFSIIANICNRKAFWGLAPFATKWRKGVFDVTKNRENFIPYQFQNRVQLNSLINFSISSLTSSNSFLSKILEVCIDLYIRKFGIFKNL